MKTIRLLLAACTLALPVFAQAQSHAGDPLTFDVVVYGGTASGVATAISATKEGHTVALIEPTQHLGGMVTGGLSGTDFGNKRCIGGFALEFYERLGKHYGTDIEWYAEPHVAERLLNEMIDEEGKRLTVFLGERLREKDGVSMKEGKVASIRTESGRVYTGQVFADCSYEGDLMAQAGVTYTYGREGQDEYGETLAGVREVTPKHQFLVKVKAHDENDKLLPEIQETPKGEPGAADKKVQAYNYRLCMTKKEGNKVPFPKPPGYNPARFKLLANLIQATIEQTGTTPTVGKLMHPLKIQNEKTDTNNNGGFSTDYLGGNWNYPDATYAEREKIVQDHYEYVAGFLYFLGHDESVPQEIRDEMNTWGLAADEFADTNNWPRQLYVREARRMVGDYVMTQHDIQTSLTKVHSIGMGSYNSDSHNVTRIVNAEGFAENEGDMQVRVKPYEIPYRMITPKKKEVRNLLVPVCFSASHVAYSTLRMEPQYMIVGEAAGIAAALAIKDKRDLLDIDMKALKEGLVQRGAVLDTASMKPETPAWDKPGTTSTKTAAKATTATR